MKIRALIQMLFFTTMAVFLNGCPPEIPPTPTLSVTPLSQAIPAVGGSTTFAVETTADWTASSKQDWAVVVNTSGHGNGTVTVNCTENSVYQRTATIIITGAETSPKLVSVAVTQARLVIPPPSLTVTPPSQAIPREAGSVTFAVETAVSWKASSDQSWAVVANTFGNGNATITVNCAENLDEQRVATITVTGKNTETSPELVSVTVTQAPFINPPVQTVELSSGLVAQVIPCQASALNLAAGQDVHLVYCDSERHKLVYANLSGGNWTFKRNWDFRSNKFGASHDLALDADQHVHISCSLGDGCNEDLGYASNVTGIWQTSSPNASGYSSTGMYSKIALDFQGKVHIFHWRWNDGAILYTTNAGGFWTTEKTSLQGSPHEVLFDSQNQLHVFYGSYYLTLVNGQWEREETPIIGYNPAVIMDAGDNLYILSSHGLWIKPFGGNWQEQEDIFAQTIGRSSLDTISVSNRAFALDEAGNLHVAFSVQHKLEDDLGYNYQLYYATDLGGDWQAIELDYEPEYGSYYRSPPMLAIKTSGEVVCTYLYRGEIYFFTIDPADIS